MHSRTNVRGRSNTPFTEDQMKETLVLALRHWTLIVIRLRLEGFIRF